MFSDKAPYSSFLANSFVSARFPSQRSASPATKPAANPPNASGVCLWHDTCVVSPRGFFGAQDPVDIGFYSVSEVKDGFTEFDKRDRSKRPMQGAKH